jgi:hypothetical protein
MSPKGKSVYQIVEVSYSHSNADYCRYGDHTQQPEGAPFYRRMVVP